MMFNSNIAKRIVLILWSSAVFTFSLIAGAVAVEAKVVSENALEWHSLKWLSDTSVPTSLNSIGGDIRIVSLFYTNCPNTCNLTIQKYKQLEEYIEGLDLTVEFVLMSLDPKNDTPEALNAYRQSRGLEQKNWHFLTSTEAQVTNTARSLGYKFTRLDDHVFHRMKIFVLTASDEISHEITMKTKLEDISFIDKRESTNAE